MSDLDAVNAMLAGAGGKAAAFPEVGTVVRGVILAADIRDQTEMGTGEIKTYADGNPMKQLVITLQTALRDADDEDDDGTRRLYARGAMIAAIRKVTPDGLRLGGTLAVKYTGNGVAAQKGWNPPKEYRAQYEPPAVAFDDNVPDDPDGPPSSRDIEPF